MGDISANFSYSEFACEDGCGFDRPRRELVDKILEPLRFILTARYGKAKITTSGPLRCWNRNARTKGASNVSRHLPRDPEGNILKEDPEGIGEGDGVDIKAFCWSEGANRWQQINPDEVGSLFEQMFPDKYGLFLYRGRTHVDARPTKARGGFR